MYGHFKYLVISFGLTNTSTTFMRLMNNIFRLYLDKSVIVFQDDILIYNKILADHKNHICEIFQVLRENNLYAKTSKYEFGKSEVDYLGHRIKAQRIQVMSEKIEAIHR